MARRGRGRIFGVSDNRDRPRPLMDEVIPEPYIPPLRSAFNRNRHPHPPRQHAERHERGNRNRSEENSRPEIRATSNGPKRNPDPKRKFQIGFKILEEWTHKESHEIIAEILNKQSGFEDLLDSTELTGDTIILVVKLLAKLCSSSFNTNKTQIMHLASKEKFIDDLQKYIFLLQLQDDNDRRRNRYLWQDVESFFNNLSTLCTSLLETIPTKACEVLPKMLRAIVITIENLPTSQTVQVNDSIKAKFQKIQESLDLSKIELERKKKTLVQENLDEDPPDNFRELSIYPLSQEILSTNKAFIRQNRIDGAYDDVDHYLDVQFRLLKEDFVAPLREGVAEFINCNIKDRLHKKFSNVRIHRHVEFISPYFSNEKSGVLLQFEFDKKKNAPKHNYKYSKRFMYGSLLCFTKDNFATIIFGRVIDRDMKLLDLKQIAVEFEPDQNNFVFNKPYIMVECSIYFEPYYHVLKALQNIYEDSFPMKKYLIDVNPAIEHPGYVGATTFMNINDYRIQLLNLGTWPNANELQLDNTQYIAYQSALTQSFSIIQGPPGTGKTYLGLQIAETLIKNHSCWHATAKTPILVVCFTNHALDQFLEGLIGTTKRILRIGGQSKNEKLQNFNIRNRRQQLGQVTPGRGLYNVRNDLRYKLGEIKQWTDAINVIKSCASIISFEHFASIDRDFSQTWFARATKEAIVDWLLGGRTPEERKIEQREINLEKLMNDDGGDDTNTEPQINPDAELDEILQLEHQNAVEEEDDLCDLFLPESSLKCLLTVEGIVRKMQETLFDLQELGNRESDSDHAVYNIKWEMENRLLGLQENLEYLTMRLNEGRQYMQLNKMEREKPRGLNLRQPHHMSPNDRWKLYFYWLKLYKTTLVNKAIGLQEQYRVLYQQYVELRDIDDLLVMKEMLVVGMTTTAAARLQATLKALKCRIVIVEEAAEVLESHIVASLTNSCQQLILIGDHKQLRPSTATYKLEKDYNLGISLFERMVRNKIQCHVLGVQHRMRPEFASLIVPAIYPTLQNHESVQHFPPIFGVVPNLYFINHNQLEEEAGDSSKQNMHEACFLIALARYLLQNGYQPEDITIVAAYSGQMFALWRLRSNQDLLLKDVRITVLDNYQGEESKIILLSLVRNNNDNKIGFLKIENRVCVALSRAKEGFFMTGNMDLLCRNSGIWPKIREKLVEQEALGSTLALRCQLHPHIVTRVESERDFINVPEGGCNLVCDALLACGHTCTRICHISDRVHATTKCKTICNKILCNEQHKCQKFCYEDCGTCQVLMKRSLLCGHEHAIPCSVDPLKYNCPTPVACKLPCNHEVQDKPCYMDLSIFKCPFDCDTRVEPCGHACIRKCHIQHDPDHLQYKCYKPCGKARSGCSTGKHMCPKTCHEECPECDIVIKKERSTCLHVFDVSCSSNVDEGECVKPCKRILSCGHICKKKCFEKCGSCDVLVKKQLPICKHKVVAKCSEDPDVKNCNGKCPKTLICGHPCNKLCKEPCTTNCLALVSHTKPVACGHTFKIPCYMLQLELSSDDFQLLQYCQEPCGAELLCKHACSGTCGQCLQGRIHTTCKEKCGVPLVCGHECVTPCRQACQPCTKECSFRCQHSICRKKCGDPCTPCVERCNRVCPHRRCTAGCGKICNIQPCNEPCPKTLKCGHDCVGFCGEPCPPLCRVCNNDELTEIFFGTEEEEDARFVLLLECKHVVENEGMENWLNQASNEIGYKRCPKCKTILCITERYSTYIKTARQDVINIKKKFFGNFAENENKRVDLLRQLDTLSGTSQRIKLYSKDISEVIKNLRVAIEPARKGRKQPINMLLIQTFTAKIQVLEKIVRIFNEAELQKSTTIKNMLNLMKLLLRPLQLPDQRITAQEIADLARESKRLLRLAQLSKIEERLTTISAPDNIKLHLEIKKLISGIHIFTDYYDVMANEKIAKLHMGVYNAQLAEKEFKEVIQAMGMSSGHWFKCPKGHYYAIGECGGATQVGKCIECGSSIGGTQHRLLESNQHAGEIDNSRSAAWPPRY